MSNAVKKSAIDELWYEVENNRWPLSAIGTSAYVLGYHPTLDGEYDSKVVENTEQDNYWMRNATFALLILVAEGEEL